jgi:polysaccharide pyruvyl transferase WcaK-like protein
MTRNLGVSYVDRPPRIGLFGLLGSGNIGNDASLEAVLSYLSAAHPDAIVDAMCMGSDRVHAKYGIEAIRLLWCRKYEQQLPRPFQAPVKVAGKVVDVLRTASWVRRHDVVIVPGMGVLEASLPLRPWGFPYSMFLLGVFGRTFGTKVALVSVGANRINVRATRLLFNTAARLAFYRSYRDNYSREMMNQRGLDTSRDHVYPDLVFATPNPPYQPGDPQIVGVGVMAYHGTNDDRNRAAEIYAAYVQNLKLFVRWLVDNGRRVRLFVGDESDQAVVREILADLGDHQPNLTSDWVNAEPVSSFSELTQAMMPVGVVIATRFHNLMCALKLCKPAISLGYAQKNIELMADMGLSEFCQSANSIDVDRLIEQFLALERNSTQLRHLMAERNLANAELLQHQFAELSRLLFPASRSSGVSVGRLRRA